MSLFRDFLTRILCCGGGAADAAAAPIVDDGSGRPTDDPPPSRDADRPLEREPGVREAIEKMQGDIARMASQIERLRKFEKENADDIFRLHDLLEKATITYSPNYLPEEEEVITGLINEEDMQENETAQLPVQATRHRSNSAITLNEDNYKMNHKNRGKFIIFLHTIFDDPELEPRPCAIDEADRVKQTFEKVGFQVIIYKNCSRTKIKKILYNLSKGDYRDDDCLCIYISTHGENGIVSAKNDTYSVNIFEDSLCKIPSLVGKPKIIFIQACRGRKVDKGVGMTNSEKSLDTSEESSDDFDKTDYVINCNKTPTRADMLIMHSTWPGLKAWRGWMMQVVCDMMDKHGDEDFMTILTRTNNEISKYESVHSDTPLNRAKQICCCYMSLRKKIYFRQ